MDLWQLPVTVRLQDTTFDLHADFRDILEIFTYLEDPDLPEAVRWRIALALFYEQPVPLKLQQEAIAYLCSFITAGRQDPPGPRLISWQQDADAIISGVNRAAGQELRCLPFVHWWSFLGWFHAMGDGQLSTLVYLRSKLNRGKALSGWEKEFYRENRHRVDLPKRYSQEELQQRQALQQLLEGSGIKEAEYEN